KVSVLAEMLNDPYSAVRYLAYESLQLLLGSDCPKYDFDGTAEHRLAVQQKILELWKGLPPDVASPPGSNPIEPLITTTGQRDLDLIRSLLDRQDRTPIAIVE
ncbi:MAG: hypothetical protein KDA85_07260, partial [Planctomycetaceae bacterium]|nr:hypothetical protein [Planctomycetaceae bacterium]